MLYIDAKLRFRSIENPWLLLHRQLILSNVSWTSPRHPDRSNVFEEARCVHLLSLASDSVIAQMRSYKESGLSKSNTALIEGEWHLRDLRDAVTGHLGCHWFGEYAKWGHARDQISFPYALWKVQRYSTTPFFRSASYMKTITLFYHKKRNLRPGSKKRLPSSLCNTDDPRAVHDYFL